MRHDWEVNRANEVKRLAQLYQNSKAAFRELVTNSLDAYGRLERDNLKKGIRMPIDKVVKLGIPIAINDRPQVICLDNATGIKDLKEFGMLFDSSKVGEDFSAGEYGIGKLACFGITKDLKGTLTYITNNGDIEKKLRVDMAGYDDEEAVSSAKGDLKRAGCCVCIHNVDMAALPKAHQIITYLSNTFAVRLVKDRAVRILVNNELVTIPKEFEAFRKCWPIYTSPTLTIEGNIMKSDTGTGALWVSKKGIRIGNGTKDLDLNYRMKGWIDCPQLNLTPDRDDLREDQVYELVQTALRAYCEKGGFRKIEQDSDAKLSPLKQRRLLDKMTGLLESMVSNALFKDKLIMPQIVTEQKKEVELSIFDHPEIAADIQKLKAKMDKYTNPQPNTTLTGGIGGIYPSRDVVNGFDASGHTKPIKTGSGTGIHTDNTVHKTGNTPVIKGPETPIKQRPISPWAASPPTPDLDQVAAAIGSNQQEIHKIKQIMTVEERRPGGFEQVEIPFGDGRPPIFVKGHRIVLNTSNTIYKAAFKEPMAIWGLWSIAVAHLFKDYETADQSERDQYIFDVLRHTYKELGFI